MQIRNLLFITALLATAPVLANIYPIALVSTAHDIDGGSCHVPPPGNFHPVSIGTTWANLAWDYQTDAIGGYRIRTYKSANNALVSTLYVAQNVTTATVDGLDMDVEYYSIINSVCGGGENSDDESDPSDFKTLILDLVVNGFQSNDNIPVCTLAMPGTCNFPGTPNSPTAFRILYGSEFRKFGMSKSIGGNHFTCALESQNFNANFKFYCDNSGNAPCDAEFISITYSNGGPEVLVARFSVSAELSANLLKCTELAADFQIQRLYGYVGTNPGVRQSDDNYSGFAADQWVSASPNPFTETLDVSLARSAAGQVQFRLFNLSGQEVLNRQFKAGQESFSFSTAHLSPGFYLLRVEADGAVQTLKVIKSE